MGVAIKVLEVVVTLESVKVEMNMVLKTKYVVYKIAKENI